MSGAAAGAEAARDIGANAPVLERPEPRRTNTPTMALYEVTLPNKKLKSFVDPQHDVTTGDIRLAHQEGFVSVEHMKRYTTLGMATDQGKVGNVIGIALMAAATGAPVSKTGTTTFRPPYSPISIGALAGRSVKQHFRPNRLTPLDSWNKKRGAVMTQAGLWWRPWYYPVTPNESVDDAYEREMKVTRESVGLKDRTQANFLIGSTSTVSASLRSGRPAMESCCAMTASFMTTARHGVWQRMNS